MHLELCSGNGEWLCAQALRDRSASWVACELRFDRSARCFQRFALRGLAAPGGNAALIVGDARDALTLRLMPGSCDRVFINHPEPPHQRELEVSASPPPSSSSLPSFLLLGPNRANFGRHPRTQRNCRRTRGKLGRLQAEFGQLRANLGITGARHEFEPI